MRIDQLAKGQQAIITTIDRTGHDKALIRRLCEMGFDEGVDVELLHRAPLGGDPIAVRVGNMVIALRRSEAALVHVEPAGQTGFADVKTARAPAVAEAAE